MQILFISIFLANFLGRNLIFSKLISLISSGRTANNAKNKIKYVLNIVSELILLNTQ